MLLGTYCFHKYHSVDIRTREMIWAKAWRIVDQNVMYGETVQKRLKHN